MFCNDVIFQNRNLCGWDFEVHKRSELRFFFWRAVYEIIVCIIYYPLSKHLFLYLLFLLMSFTPPPSLSLSFFILLQKKFSVFRTLFLKKISTHCLFQPITTAITIPILTFIFHLFHKECGFGKLHHYKMRSMRNDTVGPLLIFPRQNIISEDVSVSRLSFPSFH